MKRIEAPYLLFALVFGFMALIAPYLVEDYQYTIEGRLAMFLFQAGMEFACALATAKHLHDKWVQQDIADRQARLRMPKPIEEGDNIEASTDLGVQQVVSAAGEMSDPGQVNVQSHNPKEPVNHYKSNGQSGKV